ncbi:hypothetical protein [Micromonospora sp. KC721]
MRGPLGGGPDVDHQCAVAVRQVGPFRVEPAQPGSGFGENLVDAP